MVICDSIMTLWMIWLRNNFYNELAPTKGVLHRLILIINNKNLCSTIFEIALILAWRIVFDVIFLMYLSSLLAFLSSQPHPHQSSSSTQFSQEWVVTVQKGGRKSFNKSKSWRSVHLLLRLLYCYVKSECLCILTYLCVHYFYFFSGIWTHYVNLCMCAFLNLYQIKFNCICVRSGRLTLVLMVKWSNYCCSRFLCFTKIAYYKCIKLMAHKISSTKHFF